MPVVSSNNKENNDVRVLKQTGHIGFDSLPDQLVNKCIQNGFIFNIMCIGETGLGKSTLMETLFNTSFESTPSPHTLHNAKLKASTYELQESNVRLKLTICETVGYGDQINKHDSFRAVVDYMDVQFETYLQEELKTNRSLLNFHDSRVHVCLYFICPTGHGLKSLDLLCMKQLDSRVNIIPIIAKADTVSKSELKVFKEKIMEELKRNEVQLYQCPTDDVAVAEINSAMNNYTPFAVIGSKDFVRFGNKRVRGRQYPWGTVQVENETHCDFAKLREMLIRTNMEDLRELTHIKHYQLYRQRRLQDIGFCDVDNENKPISFQQTFAVQHSNHVCELLATEEEVRQMFVQRVKVKESELRESERELHMRFDKLQRELIERRYKMEDARQNLEKEYAEFDSLKNRYKASNNTMTLGRGRKK